MMSIKLSKDNNQDKPLSLSDKMRGLNSSASVSQTWTGHCLLHTLHSQAYPPPPSEPSLTHECVANGLLRRLRRTHPAPGRPKRVRREAEELVEGERELGLSCFVTSLDHTEATHTDTLLLDSVRLLPVIALSPSPLTGTLARHGKTSVLDLLSLAMHHATLTMHATALKHKHMFGGSHPHSGPPLGLRSRRLLALLIADTDVNTGTPQQPLNTLPEAVASLLTLVLPPVEAEVVRSRLAQATASHLLALAALEAPTPIPVNARLCAEAPLQPELHFPWKPQPSDELLALRKHLNAIRSVANQCRDAHMECSKEMQFTNDRLVSVVFERGLLRESLEDAKITANFIAKKSATLLIKRDKVYLELKELTDKTSENDGDVDGRLATVEEEFVAADIAVHMLSQQHSTAVESVKRIEANSLRLQALQEELEGKLAKLKDLIAESEGSFFSSERDANSLEMVLAKKTEELDSTNNTCE